jgi:hypothetical protein
LQLIVGVSMDHGVATFPQDGEQADQLIRVADERLYRLKHANHGKSGNGGTRSQSESAPPEPRSTPERSAAPPQPISIESGRAPERPEPKPETPEPSASSETSSASQAPPPRSYTIQRKAERVSMAGTNAYATLGEQGTRRARVLDLGFGGVAIELDAQEDLPENLMAVLHVPILPPVRVSLKPVWSQRTTHGSFRIGCAFVS